MSAITYTYLTRRFAQMLACLYEVMLELGYEENDAKIKTEAAKQRLEQGRGKLYGDRNVHHLTRAKRCMRNEIRHAIDFRPARQAEIARYKAQYNADYKALKEREPHACPFSFEHAYAKQLRVNYGAMSSLFKLSPKHDIKAARSPSQWLLSDEFPEQRQDAEDMTADKVIESVSDNIQLLSPEQRMALVHALSQPN